MKLERDDWRRQNVNHLIQRMYDEVKKDQAVGAGGDQPVWHLAAGESAGRDGSRSIRTLYADAKKWEQEGWLDYLTPQIYWQVESKGQPYAKLLAWWAEQNVKQRHLWPGNFTSKVGVKPDKEDLEKLKTGEKEACSAMDGGRHHPPDRSDAGNTGRDVAMCTSA